ncbi:MAG: alginate export family protein [Bacteroidales bacterium]|nr:alginate export family protein [Bacteroidales bacterium]
MKKIFLIVALNLFVFTAVEAQFSISAQLRPRAEMDNGVSSPRNDTGNTQYYISQRSRINLDYNADKFQMRFSLQDVRIWGNGDIYSSTGIFSSTNSMDIYEAWFKIKFGTKSDLTIGRQELNYDGQRLIAWRNWNQYGLTYDAVVFNHKNNSWDINAGLSYNNMMNVSNGRLLESGELFNSTNLMKMFNFLRIKKTFSDKLSASFIATAAGYQKSSDIHVLYLMGTAGAWAAYKSGNFEASANAYYQFGKAQSGKKVSAYMLTFDPKYKTGRLKFGAGIDYISGDNATSSDYGEKVKTFNIMYGAVFAYYGWMNYYSFMAGSTKNGGLLDVYPNIEFSFGNNHKLRSYFHFFSLANAIQLGGGVIDDKSLGQELDFMYIYNYSKDLTLQAGVSYYFSTETLEKVKGVEVGNISSPYWAWIMLTFKPTLFSTKQ